MNEVWKERLTDIIEKALKEFAQETKRIDERVSGDASIYSDTAWSIRFVSCSNSLSAFSIISFSLSFQTSFILHLFSVSSSYFVYGRMQHYNLKS